MIKAGDLRIGNLTTWGGREYVVRLETFYTAIAERGHNIFDDLSPIPLNEDWLLRMGFKKTSHTTYEKDDIHINEQGHCFLIADDPYCSHQTEQNITRVHQLQNLFFALTGEELEIASTV